VRLLKDGRAIATPLVIFTLFFLIFLLRVFKAERTKYKVTRSNIWIHECLNVLDDLKNYIFDSLFLLLFNNKAFMQLIKGF